MHTVLLYESGVVHEVVVSGRKRLRDVLRIAMGAGRIGKTLVDVHSCEVPLVWSVALCAKLYKRLSFVVKDFMDEDRDHESGMEVLVELNDIHGLLLPEYRSLLQWIVQGSGEFDSGIGSFVKLEDGTLFDRNISQIVNPLQMERKNDMLSMRVSGERGTDLLLSDEMHPGFRMYASRAQVTGMRSPTKREMTHDETSTLKHSRTKNHKIF